MTWKWGLGLGAVAVTSSVAAFMLGRRRAARGRVWWVESLGPGRGPGTFVDAPAREALVKAFGVAEAIAHRTVRVQTSGCFGTVEVGFHAGAQLLPGQVGELYRLFVQVDDEGDPAQEARRARDFAEDLIKLGVWASGGEFSSWPIPSAAGGWSHQIREATHSERRT